MRRIAWKLILPAVFAARAAPAVFVAGSAAGTPPAAPGGVVALHPAVGDTLTAAEAERFGLFTDVNGLVSVVFSKAPWGGYLALLTVRGSEGTVRRERNVPASDWELWRGWVDSPRTAAPDTAAAAAAAPDTAAAMAAAADTTAAAGEFVRRPVWPEAPLPDRVMPPAPVSPARDRPVDRRRKWLMKLDLGYKHSTTVFNDYFADMLLLSASIGRALGDRLLPWFTFQYSFGDIPDDFEDITGNGTSSCFALEAGLDGALPLGERTEIYAGAGTGYYMRSLRWGGHLFLGYDGYYRSGTAVRELQDWGWHGRLGVRWDLKPRGDRIRLLDIGLKVEGFGADPVLLEDSESEIRIMADDRDLWVGLSVGLVLGL